MIFQSVCDEWVLESFGARKYRARKESSGMGEKKGEMRVRHREYRNPPPVLQTKSTIIDFSSDFGHVGTGAFLGRQTFPLLKVSNSLSQLFLCIRSCHEDIDLTQYIVYWEATYLYDEV